MPSSVSNTALSQAVLQNVQNDSYPDTEEVISAELPASAFPGLLELLHDASEEIKTEVRQISRQTAPDIDDWIEQAKSLQADIEHSRAIARDIVARSEQADKLQNEVRDKTVHVEFLQREIDFNASLTSALEQIYNAYETLNAAHGALSGDQFLKAVELLEKVDRDNNILEVFNGARVVTLLHERAADLRKLIADNLRDCWAALIETNSEDSYITINGDVQRSFPIPIQDVVDALSRFAMLGDHITGLHYALDRIIISPRLMLLVDNTVAAISVDENTIRICGRQADGEAVSLLKDIIRIVDFLNASLPQSIALPLSESLIPNLTVRLISSWLPKFVPTTMDGLPEFQTLLDEVLHFADHIDDLGWKGADGLRTWVSQAPRIWLTKRRESSLDGVRELLARSYSIAKRVEREETQTVAADDNMFGENTNDDWNAEWSDEEDVASNTDTVSQHTKTNADNEDDVSAWGLDEEPEAEKAEKAEDDGDGDGDAWGWGDDNEETTSVPSSPPNAAPPINTKKRKSPAKPNGRPTPATQQREMTLKETLTITCVPEGLLGIIQQITRDAAAMAEASFSQASIKPAAAGLPSIPTLVLAMYRAAAPSFYGKNASGNMFLYNDSLWMAEQLQKKLATEDNTVTSKMRLDPDITSLERFGKRAYGKEMESQRIILGDTLDGAQGLSNCTEQPFAMQCDNAVASVIDHIRGVHASWKDVLSHSALLQSIGSLLSTVISKLVVEIEDLTDISEAVSQKLASYCAQISKLEDLFVSDDPAGSSKDRVPPTAVYTPNWLKFQYLANILESSLVDIKYLWTEGELRLEFTAEEVIDLIQALFADSDHRRRAIGEIRRSSLG